MDRDLRQAGGPEFITDRHSAGISLLSAMLREREEKE
jgi:hypothetical protein